MDKLIDINAYPIRETLKILLQDKTTRQNIIWATDAYAEKGNGFRDRDYIELSSVTGLDSIALQSRTEKALDEQQLRTRKKAEVFTPVWLCNMMNNYADEQWFGKKNVFNIEEEENHTWTVNPNKILFSERTWKSYVDTRRLEITCGEAPYLVSRYDAATGELILPPLRRIGLLDRKLRVVNENADSPEEWMKWVLRAYQSCYGFEYQGDNLLIARINLMMTFYDYYLKRMEEEPDKPLLRKVAGIIAWNIWQMDGLKDTVPLGKQMDTYHQINLFELIGDNDSPNASDALEPEEATYCKIMDWRRENSVIYRNLKEGRTKMGKGKLFDFVIGNPPYQEDTEGAGRQAKPVYNLFIDEIRKIQPECICLITPSRWFAGGMGLDAFRASMMNDSHLKAIVDFTNAKDCFPNISISGGVNFFIWQNAYNGLCSFTNTTNGETTTRLRQLNEFPVLVRYNHAVDIIHKAIDGADNNLSIIASGLMPFGLSTNYRGEKDKTADKELTLYASNGKTYISRDEVNKGIEYIDIFSVMISKTSAEHAGEPSKDGKFRVIPSSIRIKQPGEVCTHSYFLIGSYTDKVTAENLLKYMKTQFVRFLMLMSMSGFGLSKLVLNFVPMQNFTQLSDINWGGQIHNIDLQLYHKYGLTDEEINFIESNVKEMV